MDYAYANGVIKVIEGSLFDKAKYAKLAKTEHREFVPALLGLGYGIGVAEDSLERLIDTELIRVKHILDELSPNRRYSDAFYLTYDALNLKMLYKALLFHVSRPDALSGAGAMDAEALKAAILDHDFTGIPKSYLPLLEAVEHAVIGIENPRILSAKIDACVFAFAIDGVRFASGGSLMTYFRGFIDFANIVTLVRSRALGWDSSEFERMLISGGMIPLTRFAEANPLEGDAFAKHFQPFYEEKITKLLRKYHENHNLDVLETKLDNLLLELISVYRNDAFSIGPILYYFLKKQAEAKNIRILFANSNAEMSELLEY